VYRQHVRAPRCCRTFEPDLPMRSGWQGARRNLKYTPRCWFAKALPGTVPMSIALRQTAPNDTVDGETVQGPQKTAGHLDPCRPAAGSETRETRSGTFQSFCDLRQEHLLCVGIAHSSFRKARDWTIADFTSKMCHPWLVVWSEISCKLWAASQAAVFQSRLHYAGIELLWVQLQVETL